ncbi:MAG: methylated-DNA--[protein]-cysteine S-methyltransferase [Alphaproteobacteria bacterium]|nr:methylated-DNA--[protein]-cysteine S-methyltransferase [Alphaproteobacteria bacterium]
MTRMRTAAGRATDLARVAAAIDHLGDHWEDHPPLAATAAALGMSPHHFQRLFTRHAGLSPKQFVRALALEVAKDQLDQGASVLEAALDAGLSGPGRLHDLFVAFEALTPGDHKRRGAGLVLRHGVHDGLFGRYLVAISDRGIVALSFLNADGEAGAVEALARRFPAATLVRDADATGRVAGALFTVRLGAPGAGPRLHALGTNFQIQVWRALLAIPPGAPTTYGAIARAIGRGTEAARAIGTAVGDNPIAVLIPCHRVLHAAGYGAMGYRWGVARKKALLAYEAARAVTDADRRDGRAARSR